MDKIKRFYSNQSHYFRRRYGDEWQISIADYVDWWEKTGKAKERYEGDVGARCTRIDKRKPWTLDNIQLVYSKIVDRKYRRRPGRKPGPNSKQVRLLTVEQWLDEIGHK